MTLEQTVDIPASHRLTIDVPREIPVGRFRIVFFPEPKGTPETAPAAELPRVTRAEIDAARQESVIKELDTLPVEPDWSWLPRGLRPETLTTADIRALRSQEKYGA